MIGILKHLFRKIQKPLEFIKSHKRIFEGEINYILKEQFTDSKKQKNIDIKNYAQEDYLNRLMNSEYETNVFDFSLLCVIVTGTNYCKIDFKPRNLKSELALLGYDYKDIKNLKKNFRHHTYIIKDKSFDIDYTKVYTLYAIIGNNEIYILKGHEDGI